MLQKTFTLTQAQIQTMFGTPVIVLPSPGPSRFYHLWGADLVKPTVTAYAAGGTVIFTVGTNPTGKNFVNVGLANLLKAAGPVINSVNLANVDPNEPAIAGVLGQPVRLSTSVGNFTGNGGDVQVTLHYSIILYSP